MLGRHAIQSREASWGVGGAVEKGPQPTLNFFDIVECTTVKPNTEDDEGCLHRTGQARVACVLGGEAGEAAVSVDSGGNG
ncbi:hypothetical protein Pcinc_033640 [Petrolisthes cinctipes]|uniref:Uncharacterized protein n=1 Tax=Petrolisthes cinctipes TaxID=88211 RepID=A0AAE1ERZ6_PETCI|nr:hypothetical protein Pcinc_033640 [Petrolisthes cinctipes]